MTITPTTSLDWGAATVNGTFDQSFVITNAGGYLATELIAYSLQTPFTFKGGNFPGTGGTCGASLSAGASCAVVITFAPSASGAFTTPFEIAYADGVSPQTVQATLTGQGGSPAVLSSSDGSGYAFGSVIIGAAGAHTVTLTNTGGSRARSLAATGLSAPFAFAGGAYPGTAGTCATTLDPSQTCTIAVTFAPTAAGAANQTLSIGYSDGLAAQASATPFTGTGVTPAALAFSPGTAFTYANTAVNGSTDQTFTLANTGQTDAASVSAAALAAPYQFKGGAYPGTGGTCASTLTAGSSCTLVVTFMPTATTQSSASVAVSFATGLGTTQTATQAISGLGTTPAVLTISDAPTYDYGTVYVNATSSYGFIVSNTGGAAASIASAAANAPFGITGGTYPGTAGTCGSTLAGSSSCLIYASFSPTTTGAASDALVINYFDGVQARLVQRPVTGTGGSTSAPSTPGAPTYALPNFSQVQLTWTASSGAPTPTYTVASGTSSSGSFTTLASNLNTSTYTDTAAAAGQLVYYQITATNSAGSAQWTDSTGVVALGSFDIFSITVGSSQVTVAWQTSSGATSYVVRYGTTSGGPYGSVASTNASNPYTVTGLTPGTTYYFRVYAANATSTGLPSVHEYSGVPTN